MSDLPAASSAIGESSAMVETDIELGPLNAHTTSAHGPQHYFNKEFRMFLDNTANMVHKLKEANREFSSVTESASMKEIKGRMDKDLDEVGNMAHIMKEKLREMIRNNVESRKNPACEKGRARDRSMKSLTIALKTKLKARKSDLQDLGKTIQQEYLEVVQRRIFTVTGIKLSNEVIRVVDTGSVVQMLENALQGISAEQMVTAVDEVKEQHAVATDIGRKIREVQQTFEVMVLRAAAVEMKEKLDNALIKGKKLVVRAESAEEDNDRLLFKVVVIILGWVLCVFLIILIPSLTSG